MSLIKSTATIGFYTLLSRVLGFLRDVTIASSLGASFLSDAFFVAFKLPNFLRRLFAEGAFNSAFVPLFAGMLAVDGKEKARDFAGEAMSFLLLILLIVTVLFILAMPYLMYILAPGFSDDPDKFALTVTLTRITMPYIILISMVSLLGGVLNSGDKFAAVAATPVIMNLCLIIIPYFIGGLTPTGAHALAIAVTISGVAQWLWLVRFCIRQNMLPKLVRPRLTPEVKKLLVLIAPAALGAGVAQINLFIDMIIASQFDGGVSYLYYADRISQLPLGVIGVAVGTALLPLLSRQVREGKREENFRSQSRAMELALFLSLPATVALIVIAQPIISVMFERGKFTEADTIATFHTLIALAIGLPAFILVKILAPSFYANQDTKTPFKIATICIGVNFVLNLLLMIPLQYVGMALATSAASWLNVFLMTRKLQMFGWLKIEYRLLVQIIKMLVASCAMALVLWLIAPYFAPYMERNALSLGRFIALILLAGAGCTTYLAISFAFNILHSRTLVLEKIKKRK
ncbi:MAG: murein biosynthesis integral membrane protein MurJ [Rickettsiales bacterium]|jgi:putative peptidoglycan lipid II flippase